MNRLNTSLCLLYFVFFLLSPVLAQETTTDTEKPSGQIQIELRYEPSLSINTPIYSHTIGAAMWYVLESIRVGADMEICNDGSFSEVAFGGYFADHWARIKEGGLRWHQGYLSVNAGRFTHRDEVQSPYSQFISSEALPATLIDFRFEDDFFFFENRWVSLNLRSLHTGTFFNADGETIGVDGSAAGHDGVAGNWPDRGLQYKAYGIKFGNFRVGYQDSSVYLREGSFDVEYFFIPLPGFFVQYMDNVLGTPWGKKQNDNAIMGLFADYDDTEWSGYLQFLVDDINLNRIFAPSGRMIPDKLGLSLGAAWESPYGRFNLDIGMATKYTFQAFGDHTTRLDENYGYTYYPASSFSSSGTPISVEQMMIGLKYGENSLAVLAGWANNFSFGKLGAELEYVVLGERSPANPWHDGNIAPYETEWLNDSLLEHRLVTSLSYGKKISYFDLGVTLRAGGIWNASALRAAAETDLDPNEDEIWSPVSGFSPVFSVDLSAIVRLPVSNKGLLKPSDWK